MARRGWWIGHRVLLFVLIAVTAVSPADVWAVGTTAPRGSFATLTEHFDGSRWTRVASPSQGNWNMLEGVDAVSSNDVWAVGFSRTYSSLAIHWNGTSWQRVDSADFGPERPLTERTWLVCRFAEKWFFADATYVCMDYGRLVQSPPELWMRQTKNRTIESETVDDFVATEVPRVQQYSTAFNRLRPTAFVASS